MKTAIQAHRGASQIAPENTMEAFALAAEMKADGIELDIQLTADGHLVVLHDDTVDRTSNGKGAIAAYSLDQVRELDFSGGKPGYHDIRIPTLEEVMAWAETTMLMINIEIKPGLPDTADVPQRVLNLASEMSMAGRILISSFNHEVLIQVKRIMPSARVGALYTQPPDDPALYAHRNGFDAIHPHFLTVTPALVRACHDRGVRVHPWTVDEPEAVTAMARAGVDAVITNLPDRVRSILDARHQESDRA